VSGHEAQSSRSRPLTCVTGHEGPASNLFDLSNKSPHRMRLYLGIPRAIPRLVSTSGLVARGDRGMAESNGANPRGGSGGNQSVPLRQSQPPRTGSSSGGDGRMDAQRGP
jgi:hypothetical protein